MIPAPGQRKLIKMMVPMTRPIRMKTTVKTVLIQSVLFNLRPKGVTFAP